MVGESQPVTIASDWYNAWQAMLAHATDQIDANVQWGATRERIKNGVYEIIDSSFEVRLRYDIETVYPVGENTQCETTWQRQKDWLAQNYPDAPPVHYGMYAAQDNSDDKSKTEPLFVGGFNSIDEANHAMKTCAQAYLSKHSKARLMEKSVEVVSEKGQTKQRYMIEKGRWKDGRFVKEEEWLRKEMHARGGDKSNNPLAPPPPLPPPNPAALPRSKSKTKPKPKPKRTPPPPTKLKLRLKRTATEVPVTIQATLQAPPPPPPPPPPTQHPPSLQQNQHPPGDPTTYCTCREPDDGQLMIQCDNDACPVQWFHGRCVGILDRREGLVGEKRWYCLQCRGQRVVTAGKRRRLTEGGRGF
ncbi:hypothetical protein N0V83_006116 [Neocucurbitaria cava]|uniref:PHD-type domain-containing protein n=1 Tax=Neocucurbitaria cava TaxID=798079 RepID=A0A9W8Y7B4_9PLEO|nr:hypothetical protein N0V83_006116 [Neocucurbitaria cava]